MHINLNNEFYSIYLFSEGRCYWTYGSVYVTITNSQSENSWQNDSKFETHYNFIDYWTDIPFFICFYKVKLCVFNYMNVLLIFVFIQ